MSDKRLRFEIEVYQSSPEDVPNAWRKFWQGSYAGNPLAWRAGASLGKGGGDWVPLFEAWGHTRDDAVASVRRQIDEYVSARDLRDSTKVKFYV